MALPATDNFNRADGALGSNWTGGPGNDLTITSNQVTGNTIGADSSMYWSADTPNNDQYAQCQVYGVGAGEFCGPCVRMGATDFVTLEADTNAQWTVYHYNGGSWTVLGSSYVATVVDGDTPKLVVIGTNLEGFINTVSRITTSSGSIPASGNGGLYVYSTSSLVDNFEVGNLGSLEQEGFRFGLDDGSESAHTWEAAQDTNITTGVSTARLLRVLVNTTGDKPSTAFKWKYQKNGAGGYIDIPIGATSAPALSWGAAGTIAYSSSGGTSVAPTYPSGITTRSALILVVGQKPSSANGGTVTTPSGWTLRGSLTGANDGDTGGYTTTLGIDTGNTNIFVYTKDSVTGSESGTLSVTVGTNNVCWANIYRVESSDVCTWSFECGTGKDTAGGNVSIATGSMAIASGDFVIGGMVIPTDVTTPSQFSAQALSQSGTTFGTVTEIEEPDSGTGNDIGGFLIRASVSSGSGSGAVTMTATAGGTTTNVRGPGFVLRIRATAVNNEFYISPSSNIAAGGEATTARLTAPATKTTSDFVTGRRWDDENGSDSTDITTDDYSEFEVSLAVSAAASGYYDSRLYAADTAFENYTTTPRWTISSALSATIGQVTETNTAQAMTRRKLKTIAQITETDLAQSLTRVKRWLVGQVTETNTAQAMARRKLKAIAQALETDSAQPVTRFFSTITVTIGQVTETDLAQAMARRKLKTIVQALETDAAQAVARTKRKAIQQVSETDAAQAMTRRKLKVIIQALETNAAQAVTSRRLKAIGQASETDLAQPVTSSGIKTVLIGQVTETDLAQAMARRKLKAIAQALETDAAQAVARTKRQSIAQASETDLAQAVTRRKVTMIGQVTETDLAQALFKRKILLIGQALETDSAQAVTAFLGAVLARIIAAHSVAVETVSGAAAVSEQVTGLSVLLDALSGSGVLVESISVNNRVVYQTAVESEDVP